MSQQYIISSSQKFTDVGRLGVGLFVGSPVVSSACYYWMLTELEKAYRGSPLPPSLFLLLCGLAFLASVPMMLIGRQQSHLVNQVDAPDGSKGLWMK